MSWWKSDPKQDKGESPDEIANKISQPVTEMIRRIDEDDKVTFETLSGDNTSWNVRFLQQDGHHYSSIIVGWYVHGSSEVYNIIAGQDWMTEAEKSAFVKAVKRWIAKTDADRRLTEREEWCKLMGAGQ